MKVLVTGVKGQLGYDVVKTLQSRGHTAVGVDVEEMDITDEDSVVRMMQATMPDAVVHCAAWTAVDLAEDKENADKVFAVNVKGTEYIAKACKKQNCKMLYLSTDYVFDGQGDKPWEPTDTRNPLNVYGQTKCDGEVAIENCLEKYFIVRISWVFGVNGKNFIKTMLTLGQTRDTLTVVDDQVGSPTYTYDLSKLIVDMIETDKYGIYHATNEGECSWFAYATEIFRQASLFNPRYGNVKVLPVKSDAFPVKAKRPSNSRMSKAKLDENGFERLPTWQDALERYLTEIKDSYGTN